MSSIQNIQEQLKGLSVEELLVVIAAAAAEAKKAVKSAPKKEAKEKKGSMPKGVVPPQLHKPRAWVDYVLDHANKNGWPAITVKGQEEPLAASIQRDGAYVFESTGKPLNNKQAMSLSKQYWDRKAGVGSEEHLYEMFEAYYEPPAAVEPSSDVVVSEEKVEEAPKPKKEKKAAAPKKTEKEKEAEKLQKEAEKQAKKEAEKAATAAKKAAEKAAKKEAEKPVVVEAPKEEAPKPVAKKIVKKQVKKEEAAFVCENDGMARDWDFKGKKFLRDFDGNMWHRSDDGESAGWAGKFDPETNTIDASADEPEYEDEE